MTTTTASGLSYAITLTDDTPDDVPIWNPNGLWKIWNLSEIYVGVAGIGTGNVGRFVPKKGDLIFDSSTGYYLVTAVDTSTLLSSWKAYNAPTTVDTSIDVLLGVGSRYPQQGYFIYVDNSVTPPEMAFDSLLRTYQPTATYVRVFSDTTTNGNLEVLSATYNQSGEYVDDKILLQTIEGDETGNYKVPVTANAKRTIENGETAMVIFYDATGLPTSKLTMTVVNSGVIRQSNSAKREISSIELVSSYLSATDTTRLEVGVNLLMTSVDVSCRVRYSDGSTSIKPVDGSKILLSGLDEFIPTQVGQTSPLTLFYQLDSTESYQGTTTASGTIRVAYTIETVSLPNAYAVKLFMFPEWQSNGNGYALRHFMYSLDRLAYYEVTDLIEASTGSAVWDPTLYNTKQHMIFALDLSKVSPSFKSYRHVQKNDITLMSAGTTGVASPWFVNYETGDEDYGGSIECRLKYISSQVWSTDMSQGAETQSEWLDRLYYRLHPLFDTTTETEAPTPTHFILQVENIRVRRPISDWNTTFTISTGGEVGELALLQWVKNVNGEDLQLATAGMIIRQTLTS